MALSDNSPTMAVFEDTLYIFYTDVVSRNIHYLTVAKEGTVQIESKKAIPNSPVNVNNLTAITNNFKPQASSVGRWGILLFYSDDANNVASLFFTKYDQYRDPYPSWRIGYLYQYNEKCQGDIGICEDRRHPNTFLVAWTGTDADGSLNTAFIDRYTYRMTEKDTYSDHGSNGDGPTLFLKDNPDNADVHILWRGKNDDTTIWQGVINTTNKKQFAQFSLPAGVGTSYASPTLISLNEMITYMIWTSANPKSPYQIMIAKGRDYAYQDWMGKLLKDEHTLKNIVLPGSNNAGMNDLAQILAFPDMYKLLEVPDFGQCNECGFVTQTADVKEQMEMGYRYFGINLTTDLYNVQDLGGFFYIDGDILHSAVLPVVDVTTVTTTCLGQGFTSLLKGAYDFLQAHPKEFVIVNIKDLIGKEPSKTFIVDALLRSLSEYEDVIYHKKHEKTFADLINQPIGGFRGKIILTVADTTVARLANLILDVFATSDNSQYHYVNPFNSQISKLVDNQTNFFKNSAYTGSYKRIDWQTSLFKEKVLCDLRPFNECMTKPKIGFWHHLKYLANCSEELFEVGSTVVRAIAAPEDPRSLVTIIGWIASLYGETSLKTVQDANKFLYPAVYDMVHSQVIRADNMVNIIYTDASDYLYTDLCMQLLTDFNEYDDVNAHNDYIQVASTHVGVSCAQPNSGIASVSVRGGVAPYKYHWASTGDTMATATGLSEGYHKVSVTDALGHRVTRKVYVSMHAQAHSGLARSNVSKTEVQPYGLSNHYEADCDQLIARIESDYLTTAVGDSVTASVWIDKQSNGGHVRRHYQLLPTKNAASATADVTLYFTQPDFDEYNRRATSFKVPTNPQDSAGIRNLIIWQTPGRSTDGSGGLLTYTPKRKELFLNPADVVWNAAVSRWEVSFHTEGFGGYFLATYDVQQKNEWLRADAYMTGGKPLIQWQVAEKNVREYYVEYSFDGKRFVYAGSLPSVGLEQHTYRFSHLSFQKSAATVPQEVVYYRVRQLSNNGQYLLSETLPVNLASDRHLYVYPNPFAADLTIQSSLETTAVVYDMIGRVVHALALQKGLNQVPTAVLPPGFYIIRTAGGESHKLVKSH